LINTIHRSQIQWLMWMTKGMGAQ